MYKLRPAFFVSFSQKARQSTEPVPRTACCALNFKESVRLCTDLALYVLIFSFVMQHYEITTGVFGPSFVLFKR